MVNILYNIFKYVESFFYIYYESTDMADFGIYKANWNHEIS